jgi:hypothetical protein
MFNTLGFSALRLGHPSLSGTTPNPIFQLLRHILTFKDKVGVTFKCGKKKDFTVI